MYTQIQYIDKYTQVYFMKYPRKLLMEVQHVCVTGWLWLLGCVWAFSLIHLEVEYVIYNSIYLSLEENKLDKMK